jgi:mannitol 2-dehydrogenase
MVDCIVPATGPNQIAQAASLGIDDGAPVTHENFRQWVMEERFCNGRPPWEQVGATITADVHAYEAMKIQMLNAGHQVLANLGELLSLLTIDLCMVHPLVAAFFDRVQQTEILPCVAPVPGMTPAAYLALIKRRFSNSAIKDTTRRVAFDGSARHTGFVLPLVWEGLAAGRSIEGLCLVEALWARMCAGVREDGSTIAPNDPHWHDLQRVALAARDRPQTWLEQQRYYGALADNPHFAPTFAKWLWALWADGCAVSVNRYVQM